MRGSLIECVDTEIENAKAGKAAKVTLKMNSLQDPEMIEKLYEASNAGVVINLIIRGICSLVPQKKGFSENIKIISIVDRFLEHSRIFVFHNGGNEKIYLSSADWMTRNLSYRIETTFPIYDPAIRTTIKDLLYIQFNDNVKARRINEKQDNPYCESDSDITVRSQVDTYYYFKKGE